MRKRGLEIDKLSGIVLGLLLFVLPVSAQIIPPGLGKTNLNSWGALAVQQDLNKIDGVGWRSTTYAGVGLMSGQGSHNPTDHFGIFIFNQEFDRYTSQDWQYSFAVSYRKQNLYSEYPPYEAAVPRYKQEFRLYGRLSHIFEVNRWVITPTFRQEYSRYVGPGFKHYEEDMRLRSRFRIKAAYRLKADKSRQLIAYSEQLFAIARKSEWGQFGYSDSRFSLFYSIRPTEWPISFDMGYMLHLVGKKDVFAGHYLALDVVLKNPF